MRKNTEQDRHYTGILNILNEQLHGEIIYNKMNGVIILNLAKELKGESFLGKSYGTLDIISGKLNTGVTVTLFNNRCISNHTQAFQLQKLTFRTEYMILANTDTLNSQYNKMVCILKNAYAWSGLSAFEETDFGFKLKKLPLETKSYNWYGAKITFATYLNNQLIQPPVEEETKIIQRLIVEIEMNEKHELQDFVLVKNKIISLISFAIKNNVNVDEEYLLNYDDFYIIGQNIIDYNKYYLIASEPQLEDYYTHIWNYNFKLEQLSEKDITDELYKLEPIFNLYLSLFKYRDMPSEMVFLNIVQALETFHSRFYYDNKKEKYIESVMERFGASPNYDKYKKLLLNSTQMDENCSYIILVSRLNDLLIGQNDGLFLEYYWHNENYAQIIADTRHYYTHYNKAKEIKALKKDDLLKAIYILKILLEYHVCLVLDIDNRERIAQELSNKRNLESN